VCLCVRTGITGWKDDSTTAPEMTIGAPTRFGMRGSLPHCMTNPRLPNPFMADPRRPLPLRRRRRRRRRCPDTPLPGRITLPRPPFQCGPRPFSRPRPRDARDEETTPKLILHAAAAPGLTAPRAARSASGAQETPALARNGVWSPVAHTRWFEGIDCCCDDGAVASFAVGDRLHPGSRVLDCAACVGGTWTNASELRCVTWTVATRPDD